MTGDHQDRDWLSVPEVLALLGQHAGQPLARSTWQQWRADGSAPACVRLPNGSLRIRRVDFEQWLAGLKEP